MPVRSLPPLHAIVDAEVADRAGWDPIRLSEALLAGGARLLQVRGKRLGSGALLALSQAVVRQARPLGARVIVNDRADVAKLAGADGVHLGQDDLTPREARQILGPDALVGYSTHTLDQVHLALVEPVSYVAVGPVFGTDTKDTGYDAVGLAFVRAAAAAARACPVVAIGGISLRNAASVWAAGATSVAVISDLVEGDDPREKVERYNRLAAG